MMKKLMFFLLCVILVGCAGLADYEIDLENGYRVDRLSAHQIAIYGEEPVQSDDEGIANHLYVPAKVSAVWRNDTYIIAEQIVLVTNESGSQQPPEKLSTDDFKYWIIEVHNHRVLGPFNENELGDEISKLGLTGEVSFTSIEELR